MYKLKTEYTIYGSHYLKDHNGKCRNLHGHEYKIILELQTKELDKLNMVIDTHRVNQLFNVFIGTDHLNLNDFLDTENPTMEYMAKYFYDNLKQVLPCLHSVTVWETRDSCVTYCEG